MKCLVNQDRPTLRNTLLIDDTIACEKKRDLDFALLKSATKCFCHNSRLFTFAIGKSLRLNAMTTNFNIRNSTAGKMAIKAIIASSHIVLIGDGGQYVSGRMR
jgi:hypothetical protein